MKITNKYDYLHHHSKNVFCSPFPTVAEAVQEELEDYKTKEDEVRRLKRAMVYDFSSSPILKLINN